MQFSTNESPGIMGASTTVHTIYNIKNFSLDKNAPKFKTINIGEKPSDEKYQGHLLITKSGTWEEEGYPKPRESVVLHELLEIYYRTDYKMLYEEAHTKNINEENKLSQNDKRKSKTPGEISKYNSNQ